MFVVNFVYDDEELLEPYEWQEDDCFEEYENLPLYHVSTQQLHDFIYAQFQLDEQENCLFIVGDGHYSLVIDIKQHRIARRGTLSLAQREKVNRQISQLPLTLFTYRIQEEAYEKEFGLTRYERMKKMCLEEVIDEIFVVRYDVFSQICQQFHIQGTDASEKYLALKHKIEKGYSSLHELLYKELVQKG